MSRNEELLKILSPLLPQPDRLRSKFASLAQISSAGGSRSDKLFEILSPLLAKENVEPEDKSISKDRKIILQTQLSGQKSIIEALTKLTNITRTLVEDCLLYTSDAADE